MRDYSRALRLQPGDTDILKNRARAQTFLGKVTESIADLERVIKLDPSDVEAQLLRADLARRGRDYTAALSHYSRALDLDLNNVEALSGRCWTYALIREFSSADRDCDSALRLDPASYDAINSKAVVKLQQGDLAGGLEAIAPAFALPEAPERWEAYAHRGSLYWKSGRQTEALGDFRLAVELEDPGFPLDLYLRQLNIGEPFPNLQALAPQDETSAE